MLTCFWDCARFQGNTGGPCKHQSAVKTAFQIRSSNFLPVHDPALWQLLMMGPSQHVSLSSVSVILLLKKNCCCWKICWVCWCLWNYWCCFSWQNLELSEWTQIGPNLYAWAMIWWCIQHVWIPPRRGYKDSELNPLALVHLLLQPCSQFCYSEVMQYFRCKEYVRFCPENRSFCTVGHLAVNTLRIWHYRIQRESGSCFSVEP